jgi:phage recombination protein Bet
VTTALAERTTTALAVAPVTPDQIELIKRTVAKDATADELKLYFYDCARQGVHPLDKLIFFTKRKGKYTPITSIDFMRIQAANTGECLGISDPVFALNQVRDTPYPDSASVTVKRIVQGQIAEFSATARWSEYYPGDGDPGFMWRKMPHTMLGKCAEALALRKGFPKQLAGLYAREEMDQAGQDAAPIVEAPRVPEKVHLGTGEVIDAPRPQLREGEVFIESCTPGSGKKAGTIKLSSGEEATIWASTGQLWDLALQLCQEGQPVKATLQPGKGNFGPTVKNLSRVDGEYHDQRRADVTPGDWTTDVPPPDAPF